VGSRLVLGDFLVTARQPFSEGAFRHAFRQGRIAKAVRRRDRAAVAMRRNPGLRGRNHRHDPVPGLGVERGDRIELTRARTPAKIQPDPVLPRAGLKEI